MPAQRRKLARLLLGCVARAPAFLFVGALTTVIVAWGLAYTTDPSEGAAISAESYHAGRWNVTLILRRGSLQVTSTHEAGLPWDPSQALGPPDTPRPGDAQTAWASATSDGQAEWLMLDYPKPVIPAIVRVYETLSPGALTQVSVFRENGEEVVAWRGVDPTPRTQASGVSDIPVSPGFKTGRVKLYLDSANVPGWNEIDAVGLVDGAGQLQWAVDAQASSYYQTRSLPLPSSNESPTALLPSWCPLRQPTPQYEQRTINSEVRIVEARGWPMLALWGERQVPPTTVGGASVPPAAIAPLRVPYSVRAAPGPAPGTVSLPMFPWHPIWIGLAVDTAVYAVVAAGGYLLLTRPRRFVRELARMRRGCCIHCGYDLNFDFRGGCPECGWRRTGGIPRT